MKDEKSVTKQRIWEDAPPPLLAATQSKQVHLPQDTCGQERLGLSPREIWAGAPYLQAGQQSGCKSKGLFSPWGQDSVCIIHEPFCRWQGLATPIGIARSIRSYLAATLSWFLPKVLSDSLVSSLGLDLALLKDFDHEG